MLYLLDANVLIDASRDYYPFNRVPEFWEWLEYVGSKDLAKIPVEIHEEVKGGKDDLGKWARNKEVKKALLFQEDAEPRLVSKVTEEGYAPDLSDTEIEKLGRDPFLISYCLAASGRCVVTTEASKPRKKRANRHLPDVCEDLGVPWCTAFEFSRRLDFSTRWNRR